MVNVYVILRNMIGVVPHVLLHKKEDSNFGSCGSCWPWLTKKILKERKQSAQHRIY